MRIIADHVRAVEALTTTLMNAIDHAMLCTSYENAINLAHMLHSTENLTDQFATLATENKDLALE
jgi:hypothetical protein